MGLNVKLCAEESAVSEQHEDQRRKDVGENDDDENDEDGDESESTQNHPNHYILQVHKSKILRIGSSTAIHLNIEATIQDKVN